MYRTAIGSAPVLFPTKTDRPTSVTGRRRLERGREKEREGKRELVTLVRPGGGGGGGGESREGNGTRFVCAAAVGTFPVASHHAPTSHGTVGRWLQCKQFILRLRGNGYIFK